LDNVTWLSEEQVIALLVPFKKYASFLLTPHYGMILEPIFSHKERDTLSNVQPPSFRTVNDGGDPSNGWEVITIDWLSKVTKSFFVGQYVCELV
jgi:hypothetical protein